MTIGSSSQINVKSESRYWEDGYQRYTQKDSNKKITTTEETSKIGFDFPPNSDLDTEIETSIKKHLAEAKYIDVFELKCEVSGMYLLPMRKDGQCEFSLVFGARSPSRKYFNGKLTGVMDFNIKGVCSQQKLRELLNDRMAIQIVKAIESNVSD